MSTRRIPLCFPAALLAATAVSATCPPAAEIERRLGEVPLHLASRSVEFEVEPPKPILPEALHKPGKVAVARRGKQGFAVVVTPLPVEALWKAINDEDHYAEYFKLVHSEIVAGTPHQHERVALQAFRFMGIGRWWVTRLYLNEDLYRASDGRLWELHWSDVFEQVDPTRPPVSEFAEDLRPVKWTRGAWLFAPLGPECTLVEYFVWAEPGGFISMIQALGAKRAIRGAVLGLLRFAEEKAAAPDGDPGPAYVRPDGVPLNGVPLNGVPLNGVPPSGVPPDGVPQEAPPEASPLGEGLPDKAPPPASEPDVLAEREES